MKAKFEDKIIAVTFLGIIFTVFFYNFNNNVNNFKTDIKELLYSGVTVKNVESFITAYDDQHNGLFSEHESWIDGYGFFQRILNKKEVNNFEVLKDKNGQLYLEDGGEAVNKAKVEKTDILYEYCSSRDIPYLFVQVPYKNYSNIPELYDYGDDNTKEEFNSFLKELEERKIPSFDLRQFEDTEIYYKTDHHWTVDAAFNACRHIITKVNDLYKLGIDTDNVYFDAKNYTKKNYKDALLGSYGIKVGRFYTGKDDFSVLLPKFDTDLEYKHLVGDKVTLERKGNFADSFINFDILENKGYHNKYNAMLNGGSVENVIVNHLADNDLKALVITHSYGRPMVQYFSLAFKETRYLDPQKGRYNDNIMEYIKDYRPDLVIDMYNQDINIGN